MNMYAYVGNDPMNATDPTGKFIHLLVGAAIGSVADAGMQVYDGMKSGKGFVESVKGIDGKRVAGSAVLGAVTGGASALGKAAVTGTIKYGMQKATLNGAGRVVAGTQAAKLGAAAGIAGNERLKGEGTSSESNLEAAGEGIVKAFVPGGDKIVDGMQKLSEPPNDSANEPQEKPACPDPEAGCN